MAKGEEKEFAGQKRKAEAGDGARKKQRTATVGGAPAAASDGAFPRGGGSVLSPLEIRSIHQEVKQEVLFGSPSGLSTKKKKGKASKKSRKMEHLDMIQKLDVKAREQEERDMKDNEVEDDDVLSFALKAQAPKKVAKLTFKKLSVGMSVMGAVKEVRAMELKVSLPNHLTAVVPITELSDEFTDKLERQLHGADDEADETAALADMFSVGDVVVGVISQVQQDEKGAKKGKGSRKKIEVSLRPAVVNKGLEEVTAGQAVYGAIKSEEDHGYVVSFGADVKPGFLPKAMVDKERTLYVGQPVHFAVRKKYKKTSAVVPLSAKAEAVSKAMGNTGGVIITLNTLRAGMLVKAGVQQLITGQKKGSSEKSNNAGATGLFVGFLDFFTGTIDSNHLKAPFTDVTNSYSVGQKLLGRVLFVDYHNKKVGLTIVPHLVAWRRHEPQAEVGQLFDDAVIKTITPSVGMGIHLGNKVPGFVHISNASDEHVARLEKEFNVGEKHKCRVVGVNNLEGLLQVTFKKSILSQEFLQFSDVQPGSEVRCTVSRIGDFGLVVDLTDNIHAIVPSLHLADVAIRKPSAKFKIGQKLRCRVLAVDAAARKLKLTNKRTLVASELPVVTSYADAPLGAVVHGFVAAVKSFGLIVSFYNGISGLLPKSELQAEEVEGGLESLYERGQVLRCKVIKNNERKNKLVLSLNLSAPEEQEQDPMVQEEYKNVKLGQTLSAVVTAITDVCVLLSVNGVRARVMDSHLSDIASHCALVKESLSVGSTLEGLTVLYKNDELHALDVTHKKSIAAAAAEKALPFDVRRITAGSVVTGYVKSITAYGVFVGFLGKLTGLVQKKDVADRYVTDMTEFVEVGQTVRAYVLEVQEKEKRVALSLKQSLCQGASEMARLQDFFAEEEEIHRAKGSAVEKWDECQVGFTASGVVKSKEDYGALVELGCADGTMGFSVVDQCKGVSAKVGEEVNGKVLDVNLSTGIVDLSLRPELVMAGAGASKSPKKKQKKKTPGQELEQLLARAKSLAAAASKKKQKKGSTPAVEGALEGVVQLVKAQYVVVALDGGSCFGFLPVADYNTAKSAQPFSRYKIGMRVSVKVHSVAYEEGATIVARLLLSNASVDTPASVSARAQFDDQKTMNLDKLTPGELVTGKIAQILDLQMNVSVGYHLFGRVHITEVLDAPKAGGHPFSTYQVGEVVQAKVVSVTEIASNKFLPISHKNPVAKRVLELTLKPSELQLTPPALGEERADWPTLKKGQQHLGFVHTVTPDCLWVHISTTVRGRVFVLDVSNEISVLEDLEKHYTPGQCVECVVKSVDAQKKSLDLSIRDADDSMAAAEESTASKKKKGQKKKQQQELVARLSKPIRDGATLVGRVAKVVEGEGLRVQVAAHTYGRVVLTDIADKFTSKPLAAFKEGQFLYCYVLSVDTAQGRLDLSLRPSRVSPPVAEEEEEREITVVDPEVEDVGELEEGSIVKGYVLPGSNKGSKGKSSGVFVAISRNVTARVFVSELSDDYVKDPSVTYKAGTLVKGRVTKIDQKSGHVEMSLKHSVVSGKKLVTLSDLNKGMKVKGTVRRVEAFGVFVDIKNSAKLTGLCHKSQILDDDNESSGKGKKKQAGPKKAVSNTWQSLFEVGDYVKAVVLKVDLEKKQINLGMKPSYFTAADAEEDSSDEESDEDSDDDVSMSDGPDDDDESLSFDESDDEGEEESEEPELEFDSDIEMEEADGGDDADSEEESDEESDDVAMGEESDEESEEEEETLLSRGSGGGAAAAAAAAAWDDFTLQKKRRKEEEEEEEDSEEESDDEEEEAASKRSKKTEKQKEEEETRAKEEALLDDSQLPETIADFEKLIVTSPNSSFVWIKYVAFLLSIAEIGKARRVLERGLKRIHYREDEEKLNLWVAFMNLEHHYGSHESLMKIVERALAYNEPKQVYLKLVGIYEQSGKHDSAEEVYTRLTKKYRGSGGVWVKYGTSKMLRGDAKGARAVLQQALRKLPKAKHIPVILKFAQMEYREGHFDHGRTLFEGFVSNYPKRVDLWSVYVDMEVKYVNDEDVIRHIFERACSLNLSSKKMKFLFSKYLSFEKKHGNEAAVDHVKQKARDYLETKTGTAS